MKNLKSLILIFFLNFPIILLSQEWQDENNDIRINIIAIESYDIEAKEEGYRDFHSLSDEVGFSLNLNSKTFSSKKIKRWKCFDKSDYNVSLEHKEDSTYIIQSHSFSKNLVLDLIRESNNDKCCELKTDEDLNTQSKCCNLSNVDYDIDENWLKKNINRKQILKRAKALDKRWEFENQYSMREDRAKAYKGYSNIDSLNTFLRDFRKPYGIIHVSHISQRFWIDIVNEKDTLVSLTKIIYPFKEQTVWINNKNDKEIYNPKINLIVSEMLPNKFLHKNLIKREFIKESYLDWILNRWN